MKKEELDKLECGFYRITRMRGMDTEHIHCYLLSQNRDRLEDTAPSKFFVDFDEWLIKRNMTYTKYDNEYDYSVISAEPISEEEIYIERL